MVTLNTSPGDGGLNIGVDAFGAFGSNAGGIETSDAIYNPLGEIEESGTVFQSYVAIGINNDDSPTRTFLSSSNLEAPEFSNFTATNASSTFDFSGLNFVLNQEVSDLADGEQRTGSNLVQTYTITNPGTETLEFELIRYLDGDLDFDGSIQDTGGRFFEGSQEILFETDSGDSGASATTFVGITTTGGSEENYEISSFSGLSSNIIAGEALSNTIQGDGDDEDQFIDGDAYDVTLGLGNIFSLAPGESITYQTTTIFGSGIPEQVASSTPPLPLPDAIVACTNNDPRLITWDGVYYGFQGAGEFILVESPERQIHVRQQPLGTNVAANTAIATTINGTRVGIYANSPNPVLIDGVATEIADNSSITVDDANIFRNGNEYTLVYGNGEQIVTDVRNTSRIDIKLYLDDERQGQIAGLLGNANGDTADDLSLRDGAVLAQPVPFETLYGQFADSWRITQEESLFDYGEGESTATFTDLNFPTAPVTLDDLDPALRAAAEQQVIDAGIAPDNPLFAPTVIDLVFTQDPSVIEAALETQPPEVVLPIEPPVNITPPATGSATIQGITFEDLNSNGVRDSELVQGGNPDLIFVIDVSGSAGSSFAGMPVGDVNGDGRENTILDAELAGFIGLNQRLQEQGLGDNIDIGVVVFGSSGVPVNLLPLPAEGQVGTAEFRFTATPNTDSNNNGIVDVEEVLSTIETGAFSAGSGTDFRDALAVSQASFDSIGTAPGEGNLIFLSDGEASISDDDEALLGLRNNNVNISAFGVGEGADLENLQVIDSEAQIFTSTDEFLATLGVIEGGNGEQDRNTLEPVQTGIQVYLDLNNNGLLDGNEPVQTTASDNPETADINEAGNYQFNNLAAGSYTVREVVPSGFIQTTTPAAYEIIIAEEETVSNLDFGNVRADGGDITGVPVYRFLRTDTQTQFYTTSEVERDVVLETLPQYQLEGISFVGVPDPGEADPITGTSPVYRFFNTSTGVHLYTISEIERDAIQENLPNYNFEGTSYYGYNTQAEGTIPLYRFYNPALDAHFYTPTAAERDFFLESPDFQPESGDSGIAFYVEPPPVV
ncbi:VWD domain-containing protein [Waterburya agarophytonicola K14]|uniref:VWD domain-containing protein n=1 Tax=Waterburya agarophytonicola KI4 TaxID=2874699 RepID=A0A964FHA4_9CYAN|nr:VWD domain-containing protein [Waterburya agarophytonicola]MCC0178961.1 VWD domain-containing protein [Waterburya agarophytonicola KI4]